MQPNEFPTQQFNQALTITKKIKPNLKSFLQEFNKKNISWIYQSISILYRNLLNPEVDPLIKMNSMFAVKCIVDTCDYVCLQFVEAFLFPIIKKAAFCDLEKQQNQRGAKLFVEKSSPENAGDLSNYGYNYVKLCTEMLKALSVIKPNRLYFNNKTKDPSEFYLASIQLNKKIAHPNEQMNFYKQKPQALNQLYQKKLKQLQQNQNIEPYSQFIEKKFYAQIKLGFANVQKQGLDIRQLMKIGDMYIVEDAFTMVDQMLSQGKSVNIIRYGLQFISQIVRCGSQSAKQFLFENESMKVLVKNVINIQGSDKSLDRGKNFLPDKKGTPEQHQQLYIRFLSYLQFWANTYIKNSFINPPSPTKIYKYYKVLKENYQFQFPPILANQIKQSMQNYDKLKHFNKMLTQQLLSSEVQPQKDDSIILSKPQTKTNINVNPNNSIGSNGISSISSKQINSSQSNNNIKDMLKSQSKKDRQQSSLGSIKQEVNATPTGGKKNDGEELKKRIIKLQQAINNLSNNQKQLLNNTKYIQKQLPNLMQFIEVANLNDQQLQTYMNELIQIQQRVSKIKPIFDKYKTNKIDYKQFCRQINPKTGNISSKSSIPPQSTKNLQKKIEQKQYQMQCRKQPNTQQYKLYKIQIHKQQSLKIQSNQNIKNLQEPAHILQQQKLNILASKNQSKYQSKQKISSKPIIKQNIEQKVPENIQIYSRISQHQDRVQFQRSQINQSRFTESKRDLQNSMPIEMQQNINYASRNVPVQNIHAFPQFEPVTYSTNRGPMEHLNDNSPINNRHINQTPSKFLENNQQQYLEEEQIIQSPSLNPLNNSYHDLTQITEQSKKSKTFKEAISNQKLFIKTNKRQNLFWLQSETTSLIKPAGNSISRKGSRLQSRINVPELLQERSKKYQLQIKLLEQEKDRKIKELQNKLNRVEKQKSTITQQLKAKQYQIKSLKQNSQADPVNSRVEQYNIIDDQNYLMKKLAKANSLQNPKKQNQILKNQSRILTTGNLINTKIYAQYFKNVDNEKHKKIQLKNKQLLYKTDQLEIGYMGHLQNESYKITIFITPEGYFQLNSYEIHNDDNLKIKHDLADKIIIQGKKQKRLYFYVDVLGTPYFIPTITIRFTYNGNDRKAEFTLPCAYHKYFTIKDAHQTALTTQFSAMNTIRGEQIPYNKKILKNISLLQDYLPHIKKLHRGEPNELGQVCFGGIAVNSKFNFLIKISVKPNQFLYIQVLDKNLDENRKAVQFYIATLNHFLIKNIEWN